MKNKFSISLILLLALLPTVFADIASGPEMYVIGGLFLIVVVGIPLGIIVLLAYLVIRHIRKKNLAKENGPK